MSNFLGPDIAGEIPLETDRSGIYNGHLRVIKHLRWHSSHSAEVKPGFTVKIMEFPSDF